MTTFSSFTLSLARHLLTTMEEYQKHIVNKHIKVYMKNIHIPVTEYCIHPTNNYQ